MKSQERRNKVYVGLSGGVDSSVSAGLLKQQGFDVTGVFIKVWQPDWIECTWKEDRLDAMRVCARLDIPFVDLNLEKEYKKEVIDYMIREYRAGKTPNPDVMCNKHVKFGGFYNWAMKQGADYVATGHYARIVKRETYNAKRKKRDRQKLLPPLYAMRYTLHAGSDHNKDQSYFLWQIKKEQLAHILFPVGGMEKPEVRKLAKRYGLVTADKKDSQGLCFLGKIDIKLFLKEYIKSKSGKVLNEKGETIGHHDGAVFFTLGERHGFTVTQKLPDDKAYYVISRDIKRNTLTVSNNSRKSLDDESRKVFEIEQVNWLGPAPVAGAGLQARLRYRQPLQKVGVIIHNSKFIIHFASAQSGGASGQSIVFYKDEVCLGGGVIV